MEATTNGMRVLTDDDFHDVIGHSPLPVLVHFYSTWCTPCRELAPVLQRLVSKYDGRVLFCRIDACDNLRVPSEYGVTVLPTLVVFQGGEAVGCSSAVENRGGIDSLLESVLGD